MLLASEPANGNFAAASATTIFNVTPATPSLNFTPIAPQTFGNAAFPVSTASVSNHCCRSRSGPRCAANFRYIRLVATSGLIQGRHGEVSAAAPRFETVDLLRGLSILAVVLLHSWPRFYLNDVQVGTGLPRWLSHLLLRNGGNPARHPFGLFPKASTDRYHVYQD